MNLKACSGMSTVSYSFLLFKTMYVLRKHMGDFCKEFLHIWNDVTRNKNGGEKNTTAIVGLLQHLTIIKSKLKMKGHKKLQFSHFFFISQVFYCHPN